MKDCADSNTLKTDFKIRILIKNSGEYKYIDSSQLCCNPKKSNSTKKSCGKDYNQEHES